MLNGKSIIYLHDKNVTDDLDDVVWEMIQDGWSGKEIADRLEITIDREKGCVRRLKCQGRLSDRSYDSDDARCVSVLEIDQKQS